MSSIAFGLLGLFSFVFLISIVVVIHELGHYWAGRFCGVHAEAFSMGFGPTLLSWRDKHGTVWRVAAFPLGGYVKFLGDAGAASEPDEEKLAEIRANMGSDADKCYHFKPIWQRAFITVAGPIANFVLAITIFAAVALSVGSDPYSPPIIGSIAPGSAAETAGFRPGDEITAIDDKPIGQFQEIVTEIVWRPGTELQFAIVRDGEPMSLMVTPARVEVEDRAGGTRVLGQLGISGSWLPQIGRVEADSQAEAAGFLRGDVILAIDDEPIRMFGDIERFIAQSPDQSHRFDIDRDGVELTLTASLPYRASETAASGLRTGLQSVGSAQIRDRFNLLTAVGYGAERTWAVVSMTARYVSYVVTGRASPALLNGPLGIAEVAGQTAQNSVEAGRNAGESALLWLLNMIRLAGFLSVGLGLVNLLPIPILDGGHLVYYAYEAVARRPLSMKAQAIGFRIGLALVLGMMLLATWNDINYKLSQWF
jgi:regulator of sigma E protease